MGKYLTSSAGNGKKISKNSNLFSYYYVESSNNNDGGIRYEFKWCLDKQYGFINITVRDNKILGDVTIINTDKNSPYKFCRPLSLNNDPSLRSTIIEMLSSINVHIGK